MGTATQTKNQSTIAPPPATGAGAPEKRTRSAMSKERLLSAALASVIADADAAKPKFTSPALEAGRKIVKDFTDKILKPVQDHLTEARAKLTKLASDPAKMDAAAIQDASKEIIRLQKKLDSLQGTQKDSH